MEELRESLQMTFLYLGSQTSLPSGYLALSNLYTYELPCLKKASRPTNLWVSKNYKMLQIWFYVLSIHSNIQSDFATDLIVIPTVCVLNIYVQIFFVKLGAHFL